MRKKNEQNFLEDLFNIIKIKSKSKDSQSYTKFLLKSGKNKIAQKVGEESTELIVDYLSGSKKRTINEAADLIYHLFVLLYSKKINLTDIKKELLKRHNVRHK
jgi:phosphoribosyl-ATP pyrophosphohydrolase/phosphoribosyl-AMP cyclohydrolase